MTGRRAVLRALASAGMVATSPKVLSQRPSSSPRIGALWFASSSDPLTRKYFAIFRQRLRELGYVEGKTLFIEERFAEGKAERLNDFAREFVDAKVDIIVAPAVAAATAARRATDTIPIVMLHAGNPVGAGLIASLARPGGNMTGLSMLLTEMVAKELEILKELVPDATRLGVLWNPTTPSHAVAVKAVEAAGQRLGVQLRLVPLVTVEDIDGAFASLTGGNVSGFLDVISPLSYSQRARLAEAALKHRLPGMYGSKENVVAGGLISYGADIADLARRAAV